MQQPSLISVFGSSAFCTYAKRIVAGITQEEQTNCKIISEFFTKEKNSACAGLSEAVQLRLAGDASFILIASFLTKENLSTHDEHGILQLTGTGFLFLPATQQEMIVAIKKSAATNESELQNFRSAVGKKILAQKLSAFKHGNHNDFVNRLTGPLRADCEQSRTYSAAIPLVKEKLSRVKNYLVTIDFADLLRVAEIALQPEDVLYKNISTFSNQLNQLIEQANESEPDINNLIFVIDNLNETLSEIHRN